MVKYEVEKDILKTILRISCAILLKIRGTKEHFRQIKVPGTALKLLKGLVVQPF
jgi:hypothetical protein